MTDSNSATPPPTGNTPPIETRMLSMMGGLVAGALLGGVAGSFWFFLPGMMLGGLCGALIGAVTPPHVGRAMLLSYLAVGLLSFVVLLIWGSRAHFNAWLEAPVGSGHAGTEDSFFVWPLSILYGLTATALTAVAMARPWQARARRQMSWVGVTAAILPLLLPGTGAGWLLATQREGQKVLQAHDGQMDAQRRAEAENLAREIARLRFSAQLMVGTLGTLQYPGATPAVLNADGIHFTSETTDSLPTVVAYYEQLIGHRFRMRPPNDGGSSRFYNDIFTRHDAREVYVYIEPPISPSAAMRITLAPV